MACGESDLLYFEDFDSDPPDWIDTGGNNSAAVVDTWSAAVDGGDTVLQTTSTQRLGGDRDLLRLS